MTKTRRHTGYDWLRQTPAADHWKKIGIHKRTGVVIPLFSIYSQNSQGIGDLTDLRLAAQWCARAGLSMIQLLPLNDVGFDFAPYNAQSSFALEPMYLSLEELTEIQLDESLVQAVRNIFPLAGRRRIDYRVKSAKLERLWDLFANNPWENHEAFKAYRADNQFWLNDYAVFKLLKEDFGQTAWWEWPSEYKERQAGALDQYRQREAQRILFQEWLQWQLAEQFRRVRKDILNLGVLLMGDLPFLVSKDSADVWAHTNYFKLDLASGAPPDLYIAQGQRWGMPTYDWQAIAEHNFDYLTEKLRCAQSFYDLYRIDHFVGIFRLWSIPESAPLEEGGRLGHYDPSDETQWEAHGKEILNAMLKGSSMLPCAEDLGTVPDCSYKVIEEYGIVGTNIQRWMREWTTTKNFVAPELYRPNSIAAISTHDLPCLAGWWEVEAGTVDEFIFTKKCTERGLDSNRLIPLFFDQSQSRHGRLRWKPGLSEDDFMHALQKPAEEVRDFLDIYRDSYTEREKFWEFLGLPGRPGPFSPAVARGALEAAQRAASIFSIQLLTDWLGVGGLLEGEDPWELRINTPGLLHENNWTLLMSFSLETLLGDSVSAIIRSIHEDLDRTAPRQLNHEE